MRFHIDSKSNFGVQTTKMCLIGIKIFNYIVVKSEVQFMFAWESPPSDRSYINIKTINMAKSNSPNLTVYFGIVTGVFIQIWSVLWNDYFLLNARTLNRLKYVCTRNYQISCTLTLWRNAYRSTNWYA
jgi:hypothetical protein